MDEIKLTKAYSSSHDFQSLVKLLDAELKVSDGDDHLFYTLNI